MIHYADPMMWIAIIGATIVKLVTSPKMSFAKSAAVAVAGWFVSFFFTGPLLHLMDADPEVYAIPVAALLAISGLSLVNWFADATKDPKQAIETIRSVIRK